MPDQAVQQTVELVIIWDAMAHVTPYNVRF